MFGTKISRKIIAESPGKSKMGFYFLVRNAEGGGVTAAD
jgi:hypothetical protein